MLSAVGKLAASIFASMENPREALIAWEECVEQEVANVLRVEEKKLIGARYISADHTRSQR